MNSRSQSKRYRSFSYSFLPPRGKEKGGKRRRKERRRKGLFAIVTRFKDRACSRDHAGTFLREHTSHRMSHFTFLLPSRSAFLLGPSTTPPVDSHFSTLSETTHPANRLSRRGGTNHPVAIVPREPAISRDIRSLFSF